MPQVPHQPGSQHHGQRAASAWATLPEDQAYALLAKADAGTQLAMITGTGPDNGASNALVAALSRAGVHVADFINSISPTWYGNPVGQPVDANGNPVPPLVVPSYVAPGAKPVHGGQHRGR